MSNKKIFSNEYITQLAGRYKKGENIYSLAKEAKCSNVTLYKNFKNNNIQISKFVFEGREQGLVDLYKSGLTMEELKKQYNCSIDAISGTLHRMNVTTRFKSRIHLVNHNYFDNIDTAEKAYWLGFILTDGCVAKGHSRINEPHELLITLKADDYEQLEKFNRCLSSTYPIRFYEVDKHKKCSVRIASQKLCKDLEKFGVVMRKTGKCYKSDLIPDEFERDFWRGCIDGDGSLFYYKKYPRIDFCGDRQLVLDFANFCKKNNVFSAFTKDKRIKTDFLSTRIARVNDVKKLAEILYKDSSIFLNRKFQLYELFTNKLDFLL